MKKNRDDFDFDPPGKNLYEHIKKNRLKKGISMGIRFQKIAAAFIVFLSAGFIIYLVMNQKQTQITVSVHEPMYIDTSYQKEIITISHIVESKQKELAKEEKINPTLYKEFKTIITDLDNYYADLEKKLNETPNKEIILKAMIQNLQMQENLLKRQLLIFQNINQIKNGKVNKKI